MFFVRRGRWAWAEKEAPGEGEALSVVAVTFLLEGDLEDLIKPNQTLTP